MGFVSGKVKWICSDDHICVLCLANFNSCFFQKVKNDLVLSLVPPPQVTEQEVHAPQGPTSQSTKIFCRPYYRTQVRSLPGLVRKWLISCFRDLITVTVMDDDAYEGPLTPCYIPIPPFHPPPPKKKQKQKHSTLESRQCLLKIIRGPVVQIHNFSTIPAPWAVLKQTKRQNYLKAYQGICKLQRTEDFLPVQ